MTDQDRADAFVGTVADHTDVDRGAAEELAHSLAEEFGAVRLAERRAIVALLRRRASDVRLAAVACGTLDALADQIERGAHGS